MKGRKILYITGLLVLIVLLFHFQPYALATCEYGIHNNGLGGIYIDINSDLYNVTWANKPWAAPYMPNGCTWFVGARVSELTNNPKNTTIWDGQNWWDSYGTSLGYSRGTTLDMQYKAVACWNTHVAIIEDIHPDGTIILSEGGVGGPAGDPYRYAPWGCCHLIETTESQLVNREGKIFLGYIYLDVFLPSMDLKAQIDRGDDGVYCVGETVHITPSKTGLADNYWLRIYRTPTAAETYEYWNGQLQGSDYDLLLTDEGYYTCNYYFPAGNATIETRVVGWRVVTYQTPTETFGTCGDNITWRLYDDSLLMIKGSGGMYKDGSTLWGTNVKHVLISDGITSIGERAFKGCSNLLSIKVPDSVTIIGLSAFSGCISLESFSLPPYITSIGAYLFENCSSLKEITIPTGVTRIVNYAFYGCSKLETVVIPDTVTSIGNSVFSLCSSLKNIIIPQSVNSIGNSAFSNCSSLTEISVPYGVTSINRETFYGCSSLNSINLPGSITSIGAKAFERCFALPEILIPDAVTSISRDAFTDCPAVLYAFFDGDGARALGEISRSFRDPDPIYPYEMIYSKYLLPTGLNLVSVYDKNRETYTIPDITTSIYADAFSNCSRMKSIDIPDNVSNIGSSAFENCSALVSITLPRGVQYHLLYINPHTFKDCINLTSVILPDTVIEIGVEAFQGCSSLPTITIPEKVRKIGSNAFQNCSSLTSFEIPNNVTSIEAGTFSGCGSLKDLRIPASIEKIGTMAVASCNVLTTVYYNGTESQKDKIEIESGNEPLLTAEWVYPVMNILILPEKLEKIGDAAFTDLPEIRGIRIPETVTEIAEDAFDEDIVIFAPAGSFAAWWGMTHGFEVVEE